MKTPEYMTWVSMRHRCLSMKDKDFKHYGGRGISVCSQWVNSFDNFLNDMGLRPAKGYSLDRIDVNGDYEPANCRWATKHQQAINRRMSTRNTSGVVGVNFYPSYGKWHARIGFNGQEKCLGFYENKLDAIKARKAGEKKYHLPVLEAA